MVNGKKKYQIDSLEKYIVLTLRFMCVLELHVANLSSFLPSSRCFPESKNLEQEIGNNCLRIVKLIVGLETLSKSLFESYTIGEHILIGSYTIAYKIHCMDMDTSYATVSNMQLQWGRLHRVRNLSWYA